MVYMTENAMKDAESLGMKEADLKKLLGTVGKLNRFMKEKERDAKESVEEGYEDERVGEGRDPFREDESFSPDRDD